MRLRVLVSWVVLVLFWTLTSQSQQLDFRQSDVYIVPFSHLDLYWACTQEECLTLSAELYNSLKSILISVFSWKPRCLSIILWIAIEVRQSSMSSSS